MCIGIMYYSGYNIIWVPSTYLPVITYAHGTCSIRTLLVCILVTIVYAGVVLHKNIKYILYIGIYGIYAVVVY